MKILYTGDATPCRVKIGSIIIDGWNKGETKEIPDSHVDKLLKQTYFHVVSEEGEVYNIPAIKEEPQEEEEFNVDKEKINKMSKDALLDLTARKGIKADYTQTKSELRQLLLEYYEFDKNGNE